RLVAPAALTALAGVAAAWACAPPTWNDYSLVGAYREALRQEDRLASLRPNDLAGFAAGRGPRQAIAAQFPDLHAERLTRAERGWLERSVAGLADAVRKGAPGDAEALRKAQRGRAALEEALPARPTAEAWAPLAEAEADWAARTADWLDGRFA